MVFLLALAYVLSSCGQARAPALPTELPTGIVPVTASGVEDQASFLAALQEAGASVVQVEPVDQIFFAPQGSIIAVNGADVQVFEYESEQALEAEAAQVAPDGGSIGTSMVTWVDTPHFYRAGRIIVLYVGSDTSTLELLNGILGPQFAGR